MKKFKLYAIIFTAIFTMALLPVCSIISSLRTAAEADEALEADTSDTIEADIAEPTDADTVEMSEADADSETLEAEADSEASEVNADSEKLQADAAETSREAESVVTTIEILAEIVEIESDGVFIACDTDGNVYEMTMPESLTDEEAALFIVGAVLKISYAVETADGEYLTEAEVEVSLLEDEEAEEVRNILIEKGFVEVEFDYDDVLAYYEALYEGMEGIVYSPEELTNASQAAWGTDDDSEEWAVVAGMEEANLWGWIDYLFEVMDPDNDTSASGANSQGSDSADSAAQAQEEFTYVNNVSAEGIVQLTNEYRNSLGVASVAVDETLQRAAQIRAEELAAYGNICVNGVAHVRLDGTSWSTVLDEVSWYKGSKWQAAENLEMFTVSAACPAESSTLVNGWINSEPHRLSMINAEYTQIGVGVAWNGDTCFAVQLFGYAY